MCTTNVRSFPIELLEARIAPAAFYVSGTTLNIENAAGVAQAGDVAAASAAGAGEALLLHAGDRLYFDPDGVVGTHKTDHLWVSVTTGNALVFFKDFNGDQRFSLDELSGLAVGDRFGGSVFSDLHGSVATMLDPAGHFTPAALQRASISRLTVSGALVSATDGDTNILAGLGISNLTVLGQSFSGGLSVNGIVATGSQALGSSWGFGGPSFSFDPTTFDHVPGSSGGDVIHAHLVGGIRGILTGDGEANVAGDAGNGGSIRSVSMGISPEGFQLQTGSGGISNAGHGGAGGGIAGFQGVFHSSVATAPFFSTGHGGYGNQGDGGAGGSIVNSSFRDLDPALSFKLQTGAGAPSLSAGNGGAGGSMVNTSVVLLGDLGTTVTTGGTPQRSGGDLDLLLGSGGFGDQNTGAGGAGGRWDWFSTYKNPALLQAIAGGANAAVTTQGLAGFHLSAGDGGSLSERGGAGGSILGGTFNFRGALGILGEGDFLVKSGDGGTGLRAAGAAGRFQAAVFSFSEALAFDGGFSVSGGSGGTIEGDAGGRGGAGAGGALQQLVFDFHKTVTAGTGFLFAGGPGGLDYGVSGASGHGGGIAGLAILAQGKLATDLLVSSGAGGAAGLVVPLSRGAAGNGGDVTNLLIQAPQAAGLTLISGAGGENTGAGRGGRGGNLSTGLGLVQHPAVDAALEARLHTPAGVYVSGALGRLQVSLGEGGAGGDGNANDPITARGGGNGGRGGSLVDSTFAFGSISAELSVGGGKGGDSKLRGTGGKSGGIDHASFKVSGDLGSVQIGLADGGMNDDRGRAGGGGNYSYLDLAVGGQVAGTVLIMAPNGGAVGAETFIAGAGGSIDHLHLDAGNILGGTDPNHGADSLKILAGYGTAGALGGAGGDVTDSSVRTGALNFGAYVAAGAGGDSARSAAARGGSIARNLLDFGGDLGGVLELDAGAGGASLGRGAAARGGSLISMDVTLVGAQGVNFFAGDAGVSSGMAAPGGAFDRVTLQNHGFVGSVTWQAGGGTALTAGFGVAGAGGGIIGSTYSNLGGAGPISVLAGGGGPHVGEYAKSRGDGGAGGDLIGFTLNNAAPHGEASISAAAGGMVSIDAADNGTFATGNGGRGGWTTGFTLRDSAGPDSVTIVGSGFGSDGSGRSGHGGAGGLLLKTRLETTAVVSLYAGFGGGVTNYDAPLSVGGSGGSVVSVTGRVGELSIVAGDGNSAYRGGSGGSVRGVVLSEVTGFVRLIQAGSAGGNVLFGRGGSISGIVIPGDIGDFHSAFGLGTGGLGLSGMGGLAAGQGANGGKAGSVSFVTANRIAAIFAAEPAADGSRAVESIYAVRAREIGADTGLPGAFSVPGLRGYGDFTSDDPTRLIDGPVIVRKSGFTAQSLSVLPLYLMLEP